MTAGEGGTISSTSRSLQYTPTWALATVCFVFVCISIFIEHLINLLCNWLKRHRKTALFEAVEKLKSVLIVLGFMSLILTVTQKSISKICVPTQVANTMLPCRGNKQIKTIKALAYEDVWNESLQRRRLAADTSDYCDKEMTSLISQAGLNQLSIFIFVLAVTQIVYCVLTMTLGRAKMRRWKSWETETQTVEYLAANDPDRFRYTRQTTFAVRHMSSCTSTSLHLWTKCFFQQFFNSVAKIDYHTLRRGFISAHLSENNSFNFRKYIKRSLEDDFKLVVGISPFMWLLVVIFLLVDVHGWDVYLWVSFLPLTIVLVLGAKLQVVVARMALQVQDQHNVIKGSPIVKPNDNLFWFNQPKLVLTLLHYTLFMNSFELAFFIWVTWQYGINSCYHEKIGVVITRVVLAVIVQVMCSYITLPLYALVTQMGSTFKNAALEEKTANYIRQWYAGVKQKRKQKKAAAAKGIISQYNLSHEYCSSSILSNNRTISSEFSFRNLPTPTLGNIMTLPTNTEIIENDDQEIVPDVLTSNQGQIEMSDQITEIKTYNQQSF